MIQAITQIVRVKCVADDGIADGFEQHQTKLAIDHLFIHCHQAHKILRAETGRRSHRSSNGGEQLPQSAG